MRAVACVRSAVILWPLNVPTGPLTKSDSTVRNESFQWVRSVFDEASSMEAFMSPTRIEGMPSGLYIFSRSISSLAPSARAVAPSGAWVTIMKNCLLYSLSVTMAQAAMR